MTPDADQQRSEIHRRARRCVEPDALRQPERDQTLAQSVLHGLRESGIDPERERSDQLRKANLAPPRFGSGLEHGVMLSRLEPPPSLQTQL
jgi:hypothetical protein